jgi:hypothetical protein
MSDLHLAIMRKLHSSKTDTGEPCIRFETVIDGQFGHQSLIGEAAFELLRSAGTFDIKDLEGRPCMVTACGGPMRYERLARM